MSKPEDMPVICPYLGLKYDVQTRFTVPDEQHVCHQVKPPQVAALEYQAHCCLTNEYRACPGYTAGWKHGLPRTVRRKTSPRGTSGFSAVLRMIALFAAVIALGLLVFQARAALPGPIQTIPVTALAPTATMTTTLTATPMVMPSETPTPPPGTPTPGPLAETPFGFNGEWLVHQVTRGESLELIAQHYGTTVEVLRAINTFTAGGLWAETPVIVCKGCVSAVGLPSLRPLFVQEKIEVNQLSAKYGTDPYDLRKWNGIEGEWVEAGRWVVVAGS